jgi:hypothetical protein
MRYEVLSRTRWTWTWRPEAFAEQCLADYDEDGWRHPVLDLQESENVG